jgi:hypothetical protein
MQLRSLLSSAPRRASCRTTEPFGSTCITAFSKGRRHRAFELTSSAFEMEVTGLEPGSLQPRKGACKHMGAPGIEPRPSACGIGRRCSLRPLVGAAACGPGCRHFRTLTVFAGRSIVARRQQEGPDMQAQRSLLRHLVCSVCGAPIRTRCRDTSRCTR